MRESEIEKHLILCAKRVGGEVRKVKWIRRNKAPDRVLMLPMFDSPSADPDDPFAHVIGPLTMWVEVKEEGGAATFPKNAHERGQAREHRRMRKAGQRVVVVDSFASVEALFQ